MVKLRVQVLEPRVPMGLTGTPESKHLLCQRPCTKKGANFVSKQTRHDRPSSQNVKASDSSGGGTASQRLTNRFRDFSQNHQERRFTLLLIANY